MTNGTATMQISPATDHEPNTTETNGRVSIDDQWLAFRKLGQGPAAVIIHGIGGHKEDWLSLARALAGRHSVYAVDMLGFGESSKHGATITIPDQARAIVRLLDSEEISQADLVGNSVGGWVAAAVAATDPGRVRRLVLIDAAGFKSMFDGPPPVNFYPQDLDEMAALLDHVRFDPDSRSPAAVAAALAAAQASGDAEAAAAIGQGMFGSPRLEDLADQVTAPTLVIWGAEDRLFPPAIADLVVAHVRGARKLLIDRASHFPQLDNPAPLEAAIVDFLGGR